MGASVLGQCWATLAEMLNVRLVPQDKRKATVDSPLRGAYATLQHNLCITKNGKVLKLAALKHNTFLSIFCEAQITSSQTGGGQSQKQRQQQNKQYRWSRIFSSRRESLILNSFLHIAKLSVGWR